MDEKKKKGFTFGKFTKLIFAATDYTKRGKPKTRASKR